MNPFSLFLIKTKKAYLAFLQKFYQHCEKNLDPHLYKATQFWVKIWPSVTCKINHSEDIEIYTICYIYQYLLSIFLDPALFIGCVSCLQFWAVDLHLKIESKAQCTLAKTKENWFLMDEEPSFDEVLISRNPLGKFMKTLSTDAQLSQIYTNHCEGYMYPEP